MMLSKTIEKIQKNECLQYVLLQNNVVGMGENDGVFSYSIEKKYNNNDIQWIARNIKNKNAIMLIWDDVKNGLQK